MGVVTSYMGGNVQFRVMVKVAVMLLSSVKPLLGIDVEPFFASAIMLIKTGFGLV